MKKVNIKAVLFVLVALISVASFVFLNTVDPSACLQETKNTPCAEKKIDEDVEAKNQEMILPDVQLVKKILEQGKGLIPAS